MSGWGKPGGAEAVCFEGMFWMRWLGGIGKGVFS
jgi:hypothetical protein